MEFYTEFMCRSIVSFMHSIYDSADKEVKILNCRLYVLEEI